MKVYSLFFLFSYFLFSHTEDDANTAIPEFRIPKTDSSEYKAGEHIFKRNCSVCHSFTVPLIGSPLNHILAKRKKEWIFHYISDDAEFMKTDTAARNLSVEGNVTHTCHHFKNEISKKDFKLLLYFISRHS